MGGKGEPRSAEDCGDQRSWARVLIIDDCADDRRMMGLALARILPKVEFRMAADGDFAIEAIEEEAPDLVLLDLYMPRRSGMEVLRDLRRLHPDGPPVLIVTASHAETVLAEARAAGADDVLVKPYAADGYETMAAAIGAYLGDLIRSRSELETR